MRLIFITGVLAIGLAACSEEVKETTNKKPMKEEVTQNEKDDRNELDEKLAEQFVDEKKIVAVVDGEELNGEQYNAALVTAHNWMQKIGYDLTSPESIEQAKMQALDTIVNQALFLQEAEEAGIQASIAEIDAEYAAFKEKIGNEKAVKEVLEKQNTDKEMLREQFSETITLTKYQDQIAPLVEVTEQEIKDFYDQTLIEAKESGLDHLLSPLEEASEDIRVILEHEERDKKLNAHIEKMRATAQIELKI